MKTNILKSYAYITLPSLLVLSLMFAPLTCRGSLKRTPRTGRSYSSTSLVRGFWDEIFWPSKPRTTEEPRTITKEGHITHKGRHWDKILASAGYLVVLDTEQIN